VPVEGSNFIVEADTAVLALGYWPDPVIGETTPGLQTRDRGLFVVDKATGATSRQGVFAGAMIPPGLPWWWMLWLPGGVLPQPSMSISNASKD